MDTSPSNQAFGSTSFPYGPPASGNGNAVGLTSEDNAAVESASTEIDAIAGAIADLQNRLERAHDQLGQVNAVRTTEFEIGRLFVEAQHFSEASLSRLEMQIQEILVEAEAKAAEILREATEEAQEIRRRAQQSSYIPSSTAQDLQSAIVGFANVNGELIRELNALNAMLASTAQQGPGSTGAPARPAGSY
jgi:cell division septum initiation protein DivIVA